ncbi:hypothetical protein WJS89_10635 [Sphingomicrobium sp. XHP0235]|uniref:hypothetical protein n=1 Tax=Sphingomicrobium aquimarinum TaxID=3133971 RepID=UPI0031FF2417
MINRCRHAMTDLGYWLEHRSIQFMTAISGALSFLLVEPQTASFFIRLVPWEPVRWGLGALMFAFLLFGGIKSRRQAQPKLEGRTRAEHKR